VTGAAAEGVELLAVAEDSGGVSEGVSPGDELPEQLATVNINAATATRNNRLMLVS
jgi:hypothetical protein